MNSKLTIAAAMIAATAFTASAHAASTLPAPVQEAITIALEDEYHAEAFYDAVMDKFGNTRPFANIIRAEQGHQAALIDLMKQYGMDVPANTEFGSAEIKAAVPASFGEACTIGVQAEVDNAALYTDKLMPAVSAYPDITTVFQALSDASQQKHLPAFQRCAQ